MEKDKFDIFLNLTKKAFCDVAIELTSCEFSIVEKPEEEENSKLAIIIGITGNSKGRIILECDISAARNFAVGMNFGDELANDEEMYFNIAEFANMIAGRSATYINNEFKEREAWLSPPAIFSGANLNIISPNIQSEIIYYCGEAGIFKIDIGFGD